MKRLYGIVCANITPMTETGKLDLDSLKNYMNAMVKNGIHGVYPCGTNGEGLLLTNEERHAMMDAVIAANAGRVSCFIQCASLHWHETMENIRYACRAGADGVGVMSPVFFKTDDMAMAEYYHEACQAAEDKPVYLYNISKCTGNDISVKTYAQVVEQNHNCIGIKYSNTDILRIQDYLRAPSRRTEALIGSDSLIVSALAAGCAGEVSGSACVFPKWYIGAYESFVRGDIETALDFQNKIVSNSRSIRSVPQIPAIKAMLRMQGVIKNDTCRRPFRRLTPDEYRLLEKAVNAYAADC